MTSTRLAAVTLRLAVAAAAIAAFPVCSAETPSSEGELDTVYIVGVSPLPGAALDSDQIAAPVQSASSADIERLHALDLTEFMKRSLGSVYVNDVQNNPLQPDINYRGYTASPLLGTPQGLSVYVDGVRINQPFGDVVSWDLIPRQAISTMTLMPGSNPLFGLNTLGGALSLKTKDGYSYPGYAVGVSFGSRDRRQVEVEAGGHTDSGFHWYGTANSLADDGWRADSPTRAGQLFGKFGWRNEATDVSLSGAYADTDLNGNGLQDLQLLEDDYRSVYTRPDNTQNKSTLFNLVGTHKVSGILTLAGNAFYRNIKSSTFNGDINDDALGENVYLAAPGNATSAGTRDRNVLIAAGYTGLPATAETLANTPFPSLACVANILLNLEPTEKCNGMANRTATRQHDAGVSGQAAWNTPVAGRENLFTLGAGFTDSRAHFVQSSEFGYLTPDRGIATVPASVLASVLYPYTYARTGTPNTRTVPGPGNFADGTQDTENVIDSRVDLVGKSSTRSVYLSDSIQLSPIVRLTVSGRYDRTSVDNVDAITPEDEVGTLTASHRFSRFNPAAGLVIRPGNLFSAYLGYSEGSRAPSAIELGCADPENPCRLPNAMAGDPPLEQVVTRTVEAGIRGAMKGRVAWNLGVFRADNRHDIMFVADDTSGFGYFRNFGKTRREGLEAGATARFGALDFGANYTFLKATYRSSEELLGEGNSSNEEGPGFEGTIDIEPGDNIPLVPRHMFKTFMQWHILPQLSANVDYLHVSGVYARGNENNEHEPDGTYYLGPGRTEGYGVVNLGLEYRPIDGIAMFAQVNNVTNHRYYSAAQLGSTGFNAEGAFVARPFSGPIVNGERPLLGTTFLAPGAPRAWWVGVRYSIGQ